MLVVRAQVGDMEAFAELHGLFSVHTLAYVRALVGDTAARDVNQDVWIGVYRSISSVVNPGSFRSWLFRMARNRAVDALRSSRREPDFLEEQNHPDLPDNDVPTDAE